MNFSGTEVRLVMLQFLTTFKALPPGIPKKEKESVEELIARKSGIKGSQFIPQTEGVSLREFLCNLISAGCVLVDAFYKIRADGRGKEFPAVRFLFADAGQDASSEEFKAVRPGAMDALSQMCNGSVWSAVVFLNPFFSNGNPIEGVYTISVNLAVRKPLVDGNGNAILEWKKDADGNRIGDGPVPVEPKLFLRVEEDDIRVVSIL